MDNLGSKRPYRTKFIAHLERHALQGGALQAAQQDHSGLEGWPAGGVQFEWLEDLELPQALQWRELEQRRCLVQPAQG